MKTRTLLGLVLIVSAPGLACDPKLDGDTKRAFAARGLEIRDTHLLHYDDGVTLDRRHEGRKALRTLKATPERERTQVVVPSRRRQPITKSLDEVVLFAGTQQASSFFAAHGIDDDEPIEGLVTQLPSAGHGRNWLTPPTGGGGLTTRSSPARGNGGDDVLIGGQTGFDAPLASDELVSGGGGGGGVRPGGPGGWAGENGGSVTRYVMNDDLPLHATANFNSATLMEMQRGDRVFVYGAAPVLAAGNVFVQVQAVDRSPYPVGWMPLHWLVVSPVGDVQTKLDFEASYGLMSKVAKEFIQKAFYDDCDLYPRYAQESVVASIPDLENPGSIPYAQRYECGEYPIGEIQSSNWKLLTNYSFTTPEQNFEIVKDKPILHVDELEFNVPVMMYRLPWQTGKNYSMYDLSSGTGQGGVDAVEHTMYAKFADELGTDDAVRIHDSDFWFNVTWDAPNGVTPVAGASAYFNFCWMLPGARLEGGYAPLDITVDGPANDSHITGVTWGAVEVSPMKVCGVAALRNDPSDPQGDLTNGAQPPIRVQFVRASISGVSLQFVEMPHLYGTFAGTHAWVIDQFLGFVSGFAQNEGVMGVLFNAFVRERLEDRLAGYLFDIGVRLAQRMPNPKAELADACDTLMPDYSNPTSRYYPLYQQCVQAANTAQIAYFTNQDSLSETCYDGSRARANDGSAWTSKDDDHDVTYMPVSEDPVGIDKPFWVDGCEIEAELETTVMSGYEDLLACVSGVFDEGVNYRKSMGWMQNKLQQRCLTPAVGLLCDAYGEGDDLVELWTDELGFEPNVDGVFNFCNWYDSLTAPDLPDLTGN